jgi:hypothetical protein
VEAQTGVGVPTPSIQETALRAAGCHVIRGNKRSGTTTEGREELRTVLDLLRKHYVLSDAHLPPDAEHRRNVYNDVGTRRL